MIWGSVSSTSFVFPSLCKPRHWIVVLVLLQLTAAPTYGNRRLGKLECPERIPGVVIDNSDLWVYATYLSHSLFLIYIKFSVVTASGLPSDSSSDSITKVRPRLKIVHICYSHTHTLADFIRGLTRLKVGLRVRLWYFHDQQYYHAYQFFLRRYIMKHKASSGKAWDGSTHFRSWFNMLTVRYVYEYYCYISCTQYLVIGQPGQDNERV